MKRCALYMLAFAILLGLMLSTSAQAQDTAIKVLTPGGGEKWNMTKTYSIQWKTTGKLDTVQIDLMKGDKVIANIAKNLKNKGDYLWTVPDTLPFSVEDKQGAKIRIKSMDGKITGDSQIFEIGRVQ